MSEQEILQDGEPLGQIDDLRYFTDKVIRANRLSPKGQLKSLKQLKTVVDAQLKYVEEQCK